MCKGVTSVVVALKSPMLPVSKSTTLLGVQCDDEALKIYSESNSIAKEVGDKGQITRNLNNLSLIYSARGNQQKALETLKEMLSMAVAIDDRSNMCYAHQNLSAVYNKIGKEKLSYEHTLQAYELAIETEDLNMQAAALTNIAVNKLNNKDYDDALEGFHKVLNIFDGLGEIHFKDWKYEGEFKPLFTILPNSRHTATLVKNDFLYLFYTLVGEAPESIYYCKIKLEDKVDNWSVISNHKLTKPMFKFEGAGSDLIPSNFGSSTARWGEKTLNELRDPCIFIEDDEVYLLYSFNGEGGIALGSLNYCD